MRVLAGDIGGTKTAMAIVEISGSRLAIQRFRKYPSGRFRSLEEIVAVFLQGRGRVPRAAGFGVAGPVRAGRSRVTKLPWVVDERRLRSEIGIARVRVVNDFVAAALGIPYLKPRQLATLRGEDAELRGPIGLIGAGTGLGQAALTAFRGQYEPLASEGGHADFGPRNAVEDRLVGFLRKQFGRVSRAFQTEDRASVISRFALARRDRLCREALRLFVSIYGSEAGNLALQYRATGGLFVAGGIGPKILPALRDPVFLASFSSKPPMENLLAGIPVRVVLEPRLPLYGAAASAYRIAMEMTRPSSKTMTR